MPQLDSATWLSQIVWLAITFTVLLILMWGVALPKVRRVLEDRQSKIDGDLQEAERFKNEAEEALKAYEAALAKARSDAHAIAAEMSAKVASESASKRTELETRLAEESRKAEARIAKARTDALDSVRDVAAEATRDLTAKLAGIDADDQAIAAALDGIKRGDS
jgi:F-type H+-transporting ATPase subunit b